MYIFKGALQYWEKKPVNPLCTHCEPMHLLCGSIGGHTSVSYYTRVDDRATLTVIDQNGTYNIIFVLVSEVNILSAYVYQEPIWSLQLYCVRATAFSQVRLFLD